MKKSKKGLHCQLCQFETEMFENRQGTPRTRMYNHLKKNHSEKFNNDKKLDKNGQSNR